MYSQKIAVDPRLTWCFAFCRRLSAAAALLALLTACGGGSSGSSSSSGGNDPASAAYAVSVTVTGLTAGQSVGVRDNGQDSLTFSSDSTQQFSTSLTANAPFNVTIVAQPMNETCTISGSSGIVSGPTTVHVACSENLYPISVSVTGLVSGQSVWVQENGQDSLTFSSDSTQQFSTLLTANTALKVTVVAQPMNETCTINGGSGIVSGPTAVHVACSETLYAVSVTVTGLTSGQSVLVQDNGQDNVSFSSNTTRQFATLLAPNTKFSVTIAAQPVNETCTVSGGSGLVTGAETVNIACAPVAIPAYTVSVSVSGLPAAGESLTVLEDGKDSLTFNNNSTQQFKTQLVANAQYAVTIATQPIDESCAVTAGSGTVTGPVMVSVFCVPASTHYPAFTPPYPQVIGGQAQPHVIASPVLIPVFFADDPDQAATVAFLQALMTSREWALLAQYGIGTGRVGRTVVLSTNAPSTITAAGINDFVAANADSWATLTGAEIFIIHYPSSTNITDAPGYAWHSLAVTASNEEVAFTVMPQYSLTSHSYVQYHELAEAATDPDGFTGYSMLNHDTTAWAPLSGGTEIADMCVSFSWYADPSLGYAMHSMWSDTDVKAARAPCVSPETADPGYGAYPVLTGTFIGSLGDSNAAVSIAPGKSVTIPVRFFSYAPLAAPITIEVIQTNTNVANTNALAFSLDRTTGLNGTTANLTITAPNTPLSSTTGFATFAIVASIPADSDQIAPATVFPGIVIN